MYAVSAVSVSESGVRPVLAQAAEVALRALVELEPDGVGAHLGVTAEDDSSATHRFEATLPGYRGWQWAVVVAAPPGADHATVSESALLPGPDALIAPEFVPWEQRVRPGDLGPGDLLAPPADDPRLVPGYVATGDPAIDEVAREVGLGRTQVLSLEGRLEAAQRWYSEYGPDTEMAKAAPSTCGLCGFFLPLAGALRETFGVCANAMGADGHVVHVEYGCGAHSDVVAPSGNGSPRYEAFDDHAVDYIDITPQETAEAEAVDAAAAARKARAEGELPESPEEVIAAEANTDLAAFAPLVGLASAPATADPAEAPSNPESVADTAVSPVAAEPTTEATESTSIAAAAEVTDTADAGVSSAADVVTEADAADRAGDAAPTEPVAEAGVAAQPGDAALPTEPVTQADVADTRNQDAQPADAPVTDSAAATGTADRAGDAAAPTEPVTEAVVADTRNEDVAQPQDAPVTDSAAAEGVSTDAVVEATTENIEADSSNGADAGVDASADAAAANVESDSGAAQESSAAGAAHRPESAAAADSGVETDDAGVDSSGGADAGAADSVADAASAEGDSGVTHVVGAGERGSSVGR
ncbi:DUF3027 domain-containing protein [Nocardia coubleae]|uniref:DUF3027 domain-containing protein n=1 Tax=Nocardia coubleae TaxID=356147 RepID=A0A846W6E1_9NOCA|nr:DUF3027 domain-containing protein [Nocardia coubleae]